MGAIMKQICYYCKKEEEQDELDREYSLRLFPELAGKDLGDAATAKIVCRACVRKLIEEACAARNRPPIPRRLVPKH